MSKLKWTQATPRTLRSGDYIITHQEVGPFRKKEHWSLDMELANGNKYLGSKNSLDAIKALAQEHADS